MTRSDVRARARRAPGIVVLLVAIAACGREGDEASRDERGREAVADVRGVPFRAAPSVEVAAPVAPPVTPSAPPPSEDPASDVTPAPAEPPPAPAPAESAETPVAEAAPPPVEAPAEKPKYRLLTWDEISKFVYVPPSPPSADPMEALRKPHPEGEDIPEKVRALSGTKVAIEGFVVPLDFKDGRVSRFIVLRSPLACCFAEAPPMNQWITATNKADAEVDHPKYEVVRVSGEFDVGEETRDGYVVGIYRITAEKVERIE